MAYGVTTTTLLLTVGAAPAIASATVHLAEVGTTLAAAIGGLILVTNTKTFGEAVGAPSGVLVAAYVVFISIWLAAIASAVVAVRRDVRAVPQPA